MVPCEIQEDSWALPLKWPLGCASDEAAAGPPAVRSAEEFGRNFPIACDAPAASGAATPCTGLRSQKGTNGQAI